MIKLSLTAVNIRKSRADYDEWLESKLMLPAAAKQALREGRPITLNAPGNKTAIEWPAMPVGDGTGRVISKSDWDINCVDNADVAARIGMATGEDELQFIADVLKNGQASLTRERGSCMSYIQATILRVGPTPSPAGIESPRLKAP